MTVPLVSQELENYFRKSRFCDEILNYSQTLEHYRKRSKIDTS